MSEDRSRGSLAGSRSQVFDHPGVLLREAREAAGIDQRTLAQELYLTLHYVQAIEDGEFSRLPGETFVRGYLRSYARRLSIPESRVIELFDEYQRDQNESVGRRGWSSESGSEKLQRRMFISMALLLLGLVMLGIYAAMAPEEPAVGLQSESLQDEENSAARSEPAEAPKSTGRLTALPESQVAAWNREEPVGGVEQNQPVRDSGERSEPTGTATEPALSASAATVERPSQEEVQAVDRFEQKESQLEMFFYADCWVRVKDTAGKTLAYGVKKAGQSLAVEGESPFSVRIGNVSGAKLIFNGEVVDLNAYASKNIANFVLN